MSSHDCQIRGTLNLKESATQSQVISAITPLLERYGETFEQASRDGSISFYEEAAKLEITFDCYCSAGGGYRIEELERTVDALNGLVSEPGYLEFQDFDTGSTDEMITPYFVGATQVDRDHARVEYGITAASPWLEPVLGREAMGTLASHIRSLCVATRPTARTEGTAS